jgi:hypothetical protein
MQLIGADDRGNILILYDSRWAHPELLGYGPDDPMYRALRELYRRITTSNEEEDNDRHDTDQEAGD